VENPLLDAGAVARDRLNRCLADKLDCASDDVVWEFYTYLLKQAQKHKPDHSHNVQYLAAYKEDVVAAAKSWENFKNSCFTSSQSDNSRRGETT
jgi:hypothetical protein